MESHNHSHLIQKVSELPTATGVYEFIDTNGTVLYVGKAINLRSRVNSYFSSTLDDRPWVKQMIPLIDTIQTIRAENEVEALILESNMIRKYQPQYNLAGKDDKSFAWILIDTRSPYPTVQKTRDLNLKGRYFGPYPDGRAINHILRYLRKIYPYCDSPIDPKHPPTKMPKPCFYYHLGLCTGACAGLISPKEYRKNINNIIKTLQGKKKSHIEKLEREMQKRSKKQEFEQAAALRDKIADLRYLTQRIDIQHGETDEEFKQIQQSRFLAGIKEVVAILGLPISDERLKRTRIECYDISNLMGQVTYGSMVVSEGTTIKPSEYRVFKIRGEQKSNDPEMLSRVLTRRLKYIQPLDPKPTAIEESLLQSPHILLLDGAQPQLSAVHQLIPQHIGLLAISKGKHLKRAGEEQEDEFWIIEKGGHEKKFRKVYLENPFLFQLLRDEAHRFAIKHHRKGKRFEQKKSLLDQIPGIGPLRKKRLVTRFKSVDGIRKATEKQLYEILKSKTAVKEVRHYLHKDSISAPQDARRHT